MPEDLEEKRKHIIGLVLEKFSYLSLDDSDECCDTFNLDSSALCPLCNGDHKVNRSIFDEIKGEWDDDEYYGERTYRLKCRESFKPGIPIVWPDQAKSLFNIIPPLFFVFKMVLEQHLYANLIG